MTILCRWFCQSTFLTLPLDIQPNGHTVFSTMHKSAAVAMVQCCIDWGTRFSLLFLVFQTLSRALYWFRRWCIRSSSGHNVIESWALPLPPYEESLLIYNEVHENYFYSFRILSFFNATSWTTVSSGFVSHLSCWRFNLMNWFYCRRVISLSCVCGMYNHLQYSRNR